MKKKVCQDCGKEIGPKSERCRLCANRFKAQDPEWRQKVSVGTKASYTPELRRKRSEERHAAWERGCYGSEEWLRKNAETSRAAHARGCYDSPEVKQKKAIATKQSWERGDHEGQFTEEVRKAMSEKAAANWEAGVFGDPSEIMKARWEQGCFDNRTNNPSSLEMAIAAILDECDITYIQQYRLDGAHYRYDFFIPPTLLVEVDGEYWHSLPGRAKRDQQKTDLATRQGFTLLRIPEQEFHDLGPVGVVEKRILPAID